MTLKAQFRDLIGTMVPPILADGVGADYMYVLEIERDLLMEKLTQAINIRFPGLGDISQIPYIAFDRVLQQGPAESNASFILRLTDAFQTWDMAGSALTVLKELQAYAQNLQPGTTGPEFTIVKEVTGDTIWNTIYQTDVIGSPPTLATVATNFDWDGATKPWRSWLISYQSLVATGQSGASATTGSAFGGSFTVVGQNVSGVWVPTTSGTPVNAPFTNVLLLTGMTDANVGQFITISGSTNPDNNGTFQIVEVPSSSICVIANPNGVPHDAGPLTWSIHEYGRMPPALAWGSPGQVWGQGELTIPTVDTGSTIGGVWRPSNLGTITSTPSFSWGIYASTFDVVSIRGLVKTWKSNGTYYPNIIIAYDGGDQTAGNAYSPNSSEGAGNPNGTFGEVGANVNGVWVPTRSITSPYDCYAQGTGLAVDCSVENVT